MDLTLIIPVYNAEATLAEQLDALVEEQWSGDWEVIIANNGSTDGSLAIAEAYDSKIPNLRMIDASERRGAAFACNKGAEAARGETIAFVDADDVIAQGWVAAMGEASKTNNFMASQFDYKKLRLQDEQGYGGGTQANGVQRMWWPPFYPHAGSCGMAIKKHLHLQVGGFNEQMLVLYDTDYCIRLNRLGVRLSFVRDALMHIRNRSTKRGIYQQGKMWGQYNVLLYKKYRDEGQKLPAPFKRFFRDAARVLKKLLKGKTDPNLIFQAGWHVGLLKGSLLYRVAPPVIGLVPIPEAADDQAQAQGAGRN